MTEDNLGHVRADLAEIKATLSIALERHDGHIRTLYRDSELHAATGLKHGERLGALEQDVAVNRSRLAALEQRQAEGQSRLPSWWSIAVAAAGLLVAVAAILLNV